MRRLIVASLLLLVSAPAAAADTLTVTTNADAGAGSLRERVAAANAGDTVAIPAAIDPIVLTSGEIVVSKQLTIDGGAAAQTSVSGNDASRIFHITGGPVTLRRMTIHDGLHSSASEGGGCILHDSGANSGT